MTDAILRSEEKVRGLVTACGFEVQRIWRQPNGYFGEKDPLTDEEIRKDKTTGAHFVREGGPETENVVLSWMDDYRWRHDRPAWLLLTDIGLIELIPRKRVCVVSWLSSSFAGIITDDNVTKTATSVDAWTMEKVFEYLRALRKATELDVSNAKP